MVRAIEKRSPMIVRGDAAYAANGRARLAFADVLPIGQGLQTSVRGVELKGAMLFTHDNAGSINLAEELAYRTFESIDLRTPGGHVFLDLPAQAGFVMYCLLWAASGKLPHSQGGGGNIALPNGANTAVRVYLYLPIGVLFGGLNPDDANIDLRDLLDSQIQVQWANGAAGGAFDSGANNERIVSGTLTASIDLIGRADAYRGGTRVSITAQELSGVDENLPIEDQVLHWLIEVPVHADGFTVNRITDAERDLIRLYADDQHPLVDNEDAQTRQVCWNRYHAAERAAELVHHETDASPWVFLFGPTERPYRITHLPAPKKKPQLRVSGTDATPRVAWITTSLHSESGARDRVRRAKVDESAPIGVKTFSKSDPEPGTTPDTRGVTQRVPFTVG